MLLNTAMMFSDGCNWHVMLRCRGVAEQRAAYLGSPASLPETLGDLGFWSDLAVALNPALDELAPPADKTIEPSPNSQVSVVEAPTSRNQSNETQFLIKEIRKCSLEVAALQTTHYFSRIF
ncbi:jg11443 [Pararge aegeria aegeria]|uniref:Jg11443 protein n=1 Tax=Pararge aegeria aegeria TaxID=348720 RepID=A0A8S4RXX6_9NEOP|nr:jg11443 [Pararge aegeria aegeria]